MTTDLPLTTGLELAAPSHPTGLARLIRSGNPDEGVVVCVHGSLDRGGSFARLARRLDGPTVVAYDRRGYQGSRSVPPRADLAPHVDDLLEIVAGVAGDGPVTIVGHSFGGVIALCAGLAAPEGIHALVLYEPPMPWLSDGANPFRGTPPAGPASAEVEGFFRRMVSDESWDRLAPAQKADRIADGSGLVGDLTIIRMTDPFTLGEIASLAIPLTIGVGSRSVPSPSVEAAQLVVEAAGGRLAVIDGAGHGAHLSHPGNLVELVRFALFN